MIEQHDMHDSRQPAVEMWTDLGCPWCYVGKHRLQTAIGRRPDADRFVVRFRSFELNPDAPRAPEAIASAFIRSHGGDVQTFQRAEQQIQALANAEGLPFSLDRLSANTFDVHRVLQYANEEHRGLAFFSLVQDRYFAGQVNPFDPGELAGAAEAAGLSARRVREVLASGEFGPQVRADEDEGRALGVTGVPFTVFDRRYAMPGAHSVEAYSQVLAEAVPLTSAAGLGGHR
jgi:predicted DsbA family dithiol-disulfide isomerase